MNSCNSTVITTSTEHFEILVTKIEQLSEFFPQLKRAGYGKRLRGMVPQLVMFADGKVKELQDSQQYSPDWLELAQLVEDVYEKTAASLQMQFTDGDMSRAICVPQTCPSNVTQEQVDNILIAAAAADVAAAIAQGVASVIPQEVLGIPNPAYIAAALVAATLDVAAKTLTLTATVMQKEVNKTDACQQEAFQQVVYSMCDTLNSIKSSLDSLHTKVDLLDKKINILLSLIVKLTSLTEEVLFREVEERLADCQKLTSLYLPEAVGGRLETMQTIIKTLLSSSQSAGISTGAAESYLKMGIAAARGKNYCGAMMWYSLAYRQLTTAACCEALGNLSDD